MAIFSEVSENEFIRKRHPLSKSNNLINRPNARHLANGARVDVTGCSAVASLELVSPGAATDGVTVFFS